MKKIIRKCQDCGAVFIGPPKKLFCPMCTREHNLRSRRNLRKWYKENGWCYDCGRPVEPGKTRCAECLKKYRERKKA